MDTQKRLILITNDDGINAPGLKKLIEIALRFGNVYAVCSEIEKPGQSHSVTINTPLRKKCIQKTNNLEIWSSNGTPADCVKLAMNNLHDKKPDILLSGINHGANCSVNAFYSGTIGAVLEGCIHQIPSVGFSTFEIAYAYDLSILEKDIETVISKVLEHGLPEMTCLNINFPLNYTPSKGLKVCRSGKAYWKEDFEERKDPRYNPYYWLKGTFVPLENNEDTDLWALKNGFASIVPLIADLTAHHAIEEIRNTMEL